MRQATSSCWATLLLLLPALGCSKASPKPSDVTPTVGATSAAVSSVATLSSAPAVSTAARSTHPEVVLRPMRAEDLLGEVRSRPSKGAIINIWASWCGPCREEVPMLQALGPNLARDGVDILLVSADEPEDTDKAIAFLKANDIRLPAYLAARPLGDFKIGLNARWPGMLPATFLFDHAGKLRYFWGGPVYENEIYEVVQKFLAGSLVDGEADFTLAPGKVEP